MSSDTLTAVMLLGSATVACLVAVGAFAVEAFFRRIPLSSAGQTGAISVENGLKLNKENLSANSSFFPKIDVCACLVLFFCAFFFIIPLAMNLDGLPGKLSNLIFLGLSGNAKLPFGGSLFFTIGLGLLLFLAVGGFTFICGTKGEFGNGIRLGEGCSAQHSACCCYGFLS